jgi:hypothetical protein
MKTFMSKFLEKAAFSLEDDQQWNWKPKDVLLMASSYKPTIYPSRDRGGGTDSTPDAFD